MTRGPAGLGASRPKGQTYIYIDRYLDLDLDLHLDLHLDLDQDPDLDLNIDIGLALQSSCVRSKRGTFYNRTNRATIYNFWIFLQKQ